MAAISWSSFLHAVAPLLLCAAVALVDSQSDPSAMVGYDEKFILGVKNYAMKKWSDAIIHLGQAMDEFQHLEDARLKCFRKCRNDEAQYPSNTDSMTRAQAFFYVVLHRKHCIHRCEEDNVGLLPAGGVASQVLAQLKRKDGYNYLQVAYYREGKLKEAARTCSTFKYFNPLNQQVLKDLTVYRNTKGVEEEDLTSLKTLPYRESYSEGHAQFHRQEWAELVKTFEGSLRQFYSALEECRTLCDGPMKYKDNLEFPQVVGQLAVEVLKCRKDCVEKMGNFRSDQREDLFGSIFHYLQQGYHHLNQSLQAVQASAAQVRLEPTTKMPSRNAVFYLRQPGVTKKDFVPREDVLEEVKKRENDMSYLSMLKKISGVDHTKEDKAGEKTGNLDQILLDEDFRKFPVGVAFSPNVSSVLLDHIKPVVVKTADDYGGLERTVIDQVLTEEECQDLIRLASYGHEGDGYTHKSPHTIREKFEGLHILEAARRSASGRLDRRLTWLYLNYSRVAKELVARQFGLQQPLYFSYTHLVCRTAKEGVQDGRSDLSHPVHSDNCILDETRGVCVKEAPAYTWRDYSAILYLNGDFEGGDFFFAHSLKDLRPDVRVQPRCGRLVGFSAGQENLHGVTAVTKGKRCAIALWFTLDPTHKELTFEEAESLLAAKSS